MLDLRREYDLMLIVDGPTDGVALLTLNRPEKRNALSTALRDEISDALDELGRRREPAMLRDHRRGRQRSARGSISASSRTRIRSFQRALWASSDRYHHRVLCFPLPDHRRGQRRRAGWRVRSGHPVRHPHRRRHARFAHPEREFGDVVYAPLHDLVGGAVARELCLTGRAVDADEALRMGLVSHVVPPDDLNATAMALAVQTATAPREVLLRTKAKALRRAGVDPATATLEL